jgi:hypothetical protein
MKIVSIFKLDRGSPQPDEKTSEAMGELVYELMSKGALVDTGGALDEGFSANVRRAGGEIRVTDGPFTESKEIVGGFAIFEVKTKEEALEYTRRFLEIAGDGSCDLHEVGETPKFGP